MAKLPSCEDYEISINVPRLIKCPKLQNGHVEKNAVGTTINYVGGFCIVFPFYKSNGEKTAVRCWIASVENAQERTRRIAEELKKVNLPYFVNFEYEADGIATNSGVQPIVLMDWVNANSLKDYIQSHLSEPDTLRKLAESFMTMVSDLHKAGISHGDLQHGNILVKDSGELILVDYDSMYVPSLRGFRDDIKGIAGYQHPARWSNHIASEKVDYFSELVIYTSIMALSYFPGLWDELRIIDTETLLFSADDINSKGTSGIFGRLDSHSELRPLSDAIKKALKSNDLNDLLPLEDAIVPATKKIADGVRGKWNNQPKVERSEYIPDTTSTRAKWNKV
jgi:serine/threonine protein kinase